MRSEARAYLKHLPTLISRIWRNMEDSGKLRFYELDHESKKRLLKNRSHTLNRLAMEP